MATRLSRISSNPRPTSISTVFRGLPAWAGRPVMAMLTEAHAPSPLSDLSRRQRKKTDLNIGTVGGVGL